VGAVFDKEGSYSIGAIALDPKNPLTVWVGTGENNSQRSVSYGNGLYRTDDGGKTWKNVGLKTSEHIGRIAIDPKDSISSMLPRRDAMGARRRSWLFKTTTAARPGRIFSTSVRTLALRKSSSIPDPDTLYTRLPACRHM